MLQGTQPDQEKGLSKDDDDIYQVCNSSETFSLCTNIYISVFSLPLQSLCNPPKKEEERYFLEQRKFKM